MVFKTLHYSKNFFWLILNGSNAVDHLGRRLDTSRTGHRHGSKRPRGHQQGQGRAVVGVLHQRPRLCTMLRTCTPELQRALEKITLIFEKNLKKLKCPHISTVKFFWNYFWCQMDFWYFQWFISSILSHLYHVSCISDHREASQSHKIINQILIHYWDLAPPGGQWGLKHDMNG